MVLRLLKVFYKPFPALKWGISENGQWKKDLYFNGTESDLTRWQIHFACYKAEIQHKNFFFTILNVFLINIIVGLNFKSVDLKSTHIKIEPWNNMAV